MLKEIKRLLYRSRINLGGVKVEFPTFDFESFSRKIEFNNYSCREEKRRCLVRVNVARVRSLPWEFKVGLIGIHPNILYKKNNEIEYFVFINSKREKNLAFSYNTAKDEVTLYLLQTCGVRSNLPLSEWYRIFFDHFRELVFYSVVLAYKQGIILHAGGVIERKHGTGIVISGPTGSGKTTLVSRLEKLGYKVINDDCVGMRLNKKRVKIFPILREIEKRTFKQSYPLSLILFLIPSQEKHHKIVPISPREVFLSLYNNLTVKLSLEEKKLQYIDICFKIASRVKGGILYHSLLDKSDPLRSRGIT